MIGLYRYFDQNILLFLLFLSLMGVVLQALYVSSIVFHRLLKSFEFLLLLYLAAVSVLLRHINSELADSMLVLWEYEHWFSLLAFVISVWGIFVYAKTRRLLVPAGIGLVLLNMPASERVIGRFYGFYFVLSLALLILRAGISYYAERQRQETEITEYSVKEALDAQHSGILFAEKNGNIRLINRQMLALMRDLTGGNSRNAEKFWERLPGLTKDWYRPSAEEGAEQYLVETPRREVWQFVRKSFWLRGQETYQIIATDVTEQESITRQLKAYQAQLEAQKSRLQAALANLEELRQQEALSRMWNHVHDVLGQRISILQRELSNKKSVDYTLLQAQIDNLLTDLNFPEEEEPLQGYRDIINAFLPLGIRFHTQGQLPEDPVLAQKVVEIIREAVTNAVRHGGAENIYIQIEQTDKIRLTIENDGRPATGEIRWGGGLRAIQRRVEESAGKLAIQAEPRFQLSVELPQAEKEAAKIRV